MTDLLVRVASKIAAMPAAEDPDRSLGTHILMVPVGMPGIMDDSSAATRVQDGFGIWTRDAGLIAALEEGGLYRLAMEKVAEEPEMLPPPPAPPPVDPAS